MEEGTVAVRTRTGEDLGSMTVEAFAERMSEEIGRRSN
jgi:threonyl-tRNA synthetase